MNRKPPGDCLVQRIECPSDLLSLVEANPGRYPCLLESTGENTRQGRYDILFAFPGDTLISQPDGQVTYNGHTLSGGFIDHLDRLYNEARTPSAQTPIDLPFCGGWFLFLGYELAAEIEPVLVPSLAEPELPRGMLIRIPAGVVHDRTSHEYYAFASGENAGQMLTDIVHDCSVHVPGSDHDATVHCALGEEDGSIFIDGVNRIKEYIRCGDIFQANLSRPWQIECDPPISPFDAYARLRQTNPAPFSCLAWLDRQNCILSSSPERLIESRQGSIWTRPIAGTYPRGRNSDEDRRMSADLLMHPKERAEHIMLVDLERNDLGRICEPGSVHVPEQMVVETYAHVHHIVSEVSGRLCRGVLPGDIIKAVFPGGTITGCPKIRCMEIIAELEQGPRNAYTGSVGYLGTNGDMDLNILIRTITWHNGQYSLRAGAGIVADSDPQRELAETRSKAKGMCRVFMHD